MKKVIHSIILILTITSAIGQKWIPPVLPQTGKTISAFVPKGYTIIDSATGDLNNDKQPDIAFVIQANDTFDELRPDTSKLRSCPRILVILFKDERGYHLAEQNNTFMLRFGEGGWEPDPYGKIIIESGVVQIMYSFMKSHPSYEFRYLKDAFYLVKASNYFTSGNQVYGWDIDFVAQKLEQGRGLIDPEADSSGVENADTLKQEEQEPVKICPPKKLNDLLMPGIWQVTSDGINY